MGVGVEFGFESMEKRMREVSDKANGMSPPLFPRVHVNDTEKVGWSRRPPRAPVALYRTVRSQSKVSDSSSTLSLTPATTSFSRGACIVGKREKNLFIPFNDPASPSKFADKRKSSSQNVSKSNVTVDSLDGKVAKGLNYPTLGGSLSLVTKPNPFENNENHFKNLSFKNLSSLDHLKVPIVGCSEKNLSCGKDPQASTDLLLQLHTSSKKAVKGAAILERSREYLRKQCEDNATMQPQDLTNTVQNFESSKRSSASGDQEIIRSSENDPNSVPFGQKPVLECLGDLGEESSFKVRTELSRRSLIRFHNESPEKPDTVHQSELVVGVHNHDDVSDSSWMDSASGLTASPNHVVKVIRDKQYLKMRTAMIDQQRIFAAQVFELHRLITVQKTFARWPNMLLEGKCNTAKPGTTKKFSQVLQMVPKVMRNSEKLKPATEYLEERTIPKLPLPLLSKELVTQQCHPAMTNGHPSSPCWFSAPGNHWLVPVVSPSEGLVYKPYAGPRPPTSSFMVPMFGNESFETAPRFPVPYPFSNSYFPPNATPHANPFGHAQSWCSTPDHISQGKQFCIRRPAASPDSEVQGSTASSPPERHKPDVLPLFPIEPTCPEAKTDEHKQRLHAIKAIPHKQTSASESAARILSFIQEERKHSDNMIS